MWREREVYGQINNWEILGLNKQIFLLQELSEPVTCSYLLWLMEVREPRHYILSHLCDIRMILWGFPLRKCSSKYILENAILDFQCVHTKDNMDWGHFPQDRLQQKNNFISLSWHSLVHFLPWKLHRLPSSLLQLTAHGQTYIQKSAVWQVQSDTFLHESQATLTSSTEPSSSWNTFVFNPRGFLGFREHHK